MFDSMHILKKICFPLIFLGITGEFITSLFHFYRRMSELNVTSTEYALLTATIVLFSGKSCLSGKVCIKFGKTRSLWLRYSLQKNVLSLFYHFPF